MDKLRELADLLRKRLPPLLPVRVYVREHIEGGAHGMAWMARRRGGHPSHFVILVRTAAWQVMKDTLLHEWAHVIAWTEGHDTVDDHGPEWGLAMSRVYQEAVQV